MRWKELCDFVDKHKTAIPSDVKVGNIGHYGELDQELDALEYNKDKECVVLVGMPISYPEPD